MRTALLALILLAFGAYSIYVMWDFGYLGIWRAGFANAAALQILLDLVITCLLISSWMMLPASDFGTSTGTSSTTSCPFHVVSSTLTMLRSPGTSSLVGTLTSLMSP